MDWPAGLDGRVEEELADFLGRPAGSQVVIGFLVQGRLRRGGGYRAQDNDQDERSRPENAFHGSSSGTD